MEYAWLCHRSTRRGLPRSLAADSRAVAPFVPGIAHSLRQFAPRPEGRGYIPSRPSSFRSRVEGRGSRVEGRGSRVEGATACPERQAVLTFCEPRLLYNEVVRALEQHQWWPEIRDLVKRRVAGDSWINIWIEQSRRSSAVPPLMAVFSAWTYYRRAGLTRRQSATIDISCAILSVPIVGLAVMPALELSVWTGAIVLLAMLAVKVLLSSLFTAWWVKVRQNPFDDIPEVWGASPKETE